MPRDPPRQHSSFDAAGPSEYRSRGADEEESESMRALWMLGIVCAAIVSPVAGAQTGKAAATEGALTRLGSEDAAVRRAAAAELGDLGSSARAAAPALVAALHDPDRQVQAEA